MAAVVAIAVLVIVGLGLRGATEFPAGSPENGLQQFLNAGLDGDSSALIGRLVPEQRAVCEQEADDSTYGGVRGMSGIGFELDEMIVDGATAYAEVTQRHSDDGDPFDGGSWTNAYTFDLRLVDGEWLIDEPSWPWWVSRCTRSDA